MNTLGEIKSTVYRHLSEMDGVPNYDINIVINKINSVIQQLCKGSFENILTKQIYSGGDMLFLRTNKAYERKLGTTVIAQANPPQSFLNVNDVSNFDNEGVIYSMGNVMRYAETVENPTDGYFQGTTAIPFVGPQGIIPAGSGVEQLFELPTDYDKHFMMKKYDKGNEINIPFKDYKYGDLYLYYTFLALNETGREYLKINGENGTYFLFYYKKIEILEEDSDECVLPGSSGVDIIAPIAAGELLYETEEDNQADRLLNIGYSKISQFYKEYSENTREKRITVKYKKTGFYPYLRGVRTF